MPGGTAMDGWRNELDTIGVAAQKIARIVQEFIKLSLVEGGLYETVDLGDVVRKAVAKFSSREDAQDIAILESIPLEPLILRANAQLIDQVIQNILTNSLEAMPHGGRIDIQAGFAEGQQVYCSIRDSGYGIDAADLKRVFEPGYTTKVEAGVVRGIGLGLYTAERIIKSHGGSIWLESVVGKYTTATFMLPREPPDHIEHLDSTLPPGTIPAREIVSGEDSPNGR
jgi:signal transduction histidine kinase